MVEVGVGFFEVVHLVELVVPLVQDEVVIVVAGYGDVEH
jgi:hypothetical protein